MLLVSLLSNALEGLRNLYARRLPEARYPLKFSVSGAFPFRRPSCPMVAEVVTSLQCTACLPALNQTLVDHFGPYLIGMTGKVM